MTFAPSCLLSILLCASFLVPATRAQCLDSSEASLADPNGGPNDNFGFAVAGSGSWMFVGAPRDNAGSFSPGSVTVYQEQGADYVDTGFLDPGPGAPLVNHRFGSSMHADGDAILVSSPGYTQDSGRVYVFERQGSNWVKVQNLDSVPGNLGERFGEDLHFAGDWAIIGTRAGGVDTFHHTGTQWLHAGLLHPFGSSTGTGFGAAVRIQDGVAFVGAPGDTQAGGLAQRGAVFTYRFVDGAWAPFEVLRPTSSDAGDGVGHSLAIDGDYLAIGSIGQVSRRHCWVYHFDGTHWMQGARLSAPFADPFGPRAVGFGSSVGLQDGLLAVGAPRLNAKFQGTGAVLLFDHSPLGWIYRSTLTGTGTTGGGRLGRNLAFVGSRLIAGAHMQNAPYTNQGAARIFDLNATSDFTFCPPAANSTFPAGAQLGHQGSASLSLDQLVLTVRGSTPNHIGMLLFARYQAGRRMFGDGFLCIGSRFTRIGSPIQASASGDVSIPISLATLPAGSSSAPAIAIPIPVGTSRSNRINLQWWYRDTAAGGSGFNLSEAYSMLLCP